MIDWWKDKGNTTLPAVYVPFNEVDDINNSVVPSRIGYTSLDYRSVNKTIDDFGHIFYEQDDAISASGRFAFATVPDSRGRHDLVMSPHLHVGKHILTSFVMKWGRADTNFTGFKNLFWHGLYSGKGGYNLEVSNTGQIRQYIWANNGNTSGASAGNGSSPANMCPKNTKLHVFVDWHVESETRMVVKIYVALLNGGLLNGGAPVASFPVNAPIPNLSGDNGPHWIGYEGGIALDIRDFLVVVTPSDPVDGDDPLITKLRMWYKNPAHTYQFPEFLRAPSHDNAPRSADFYLSDWSLNGKTGRGLINMYPFIKRYALMNSAYKGLHIGLSVGAAQLVAGVYEVVALRKLLDYCWKYGLKVKLMFSEQTYNDMDEIPDHFPHWKKHYWHGASGQIRESRAAIYWDEADTFDVASEIFTNPDWPTYNPARANSGTYRYFHNVWTMVNAVADHPALAGITTGETSGKAVGDRDRVSANTNGQFNRAGIYGITDVSGVYQLSKIYSMRRQRVALGKLMQMVSMQLRNRSDVMKSIQVNFIRTDMGGAPISPVYVKSTRTFSRASHGYADGDAQFLDIGSSSAVTAGMAYNTCYYVRNATANTYQLSLSPTGEILEFNDMPSGSFIFICPINKWQEIQVDAARASYTINGMVLSDQSRELRLMGELMYQYGFVTSGPDILAFELEKPIFYIGPYSDGFPGTWSVVEMRLNMQLGRGIFTDIPLGEKFEIQSQDSTFSNETDPWFDAFLPLYGNKSGGRYSVEQAMAYAVDRLKVNDIIVFNANIYPQKWIPDGVKKISQY